MKNVSLILNVVLLVAVAVLYFLHFSGPGTVSGNNAISSTGMPQVAFIYSDSVLQNYDYLEVMNKQLEEKTKKMDQDYRNRAEGLQSEINNYQRNVGNYTLSQARALEEDLARKQQNLRVYEQTLTQELMGENQKLQKELYDRVTAYLKKYGQEKGLQIVLKFDPTSDVMFASDSLDITSEVISGLNSEYTSEGQAEPKADTTKAK